MFNISTIFKCNFLEILTNYLFIEKVNKKTFGYILFANAIFWNNTIPKFIIFLKLTDNNQTK